MPYFNIIIFLASCLVLLKAGTLAVKYLVKVAQFLKWSEFMVAFFVMAFITTLPELFVGITSALHGTPEISFGNVMGSNVINLTLAVAIAVFLAKSLKTESSITRKTALYTVFITALPILLLLDKTLSRIDAFILLIALGIYLRHLFYYRSRFAKALNKAEEAPEQEQATFKSFFHDLSIFVVSAVFLLLSAEGIVWSASAFSAELGLPVLLIAILLVALGTNLPEIVFSLQAVSSGHKDMVLGNLMGAAIINSSWVLATTSFISPLKTASLSPYIVGIIFTAFTVTFFALFSRSGREISRKEGVILLFIYLAFILSQIMVS